MSLVAHFTISLILGILVANYVVNSTILWLVISIGFVLEGTFLLLANKLPKLYINCLGFVLGGLLLAINFYQGQALNPYLGHEVTLKGRIKSIVQTKDGITSLNFKIQNIEFQSKTYKGYGNMVRVSIKNIKQPLFYGQEISIKGQIAKPKGVRNPGGFDHQKYLEQQGIYYHMFTEGYKVKSLTNSNGIINNLYNWRADFLKDLTEIVPEKEAGLIAAVVLGDKTKLESDTYQALQEVGLVHIFTVSGLHVGFIFLFLHIILFFVPIPRGWKTVVIVPCLLVYGTVTLWTPSVTRAIIMALIAWWAYVRGKLKDFYTSLSLAALIILISQPQALFNPGFQLSFVTTWGLIYFYPLVEKWICFLPKWRTALIIPFCAWLATSPLTIFYFHQLSIIAPIVNLIAVGLVGVGVNLAFFGILLNFFSSNIAQIPFSSAGAILWLIEELCLSLRDFSFAHITVGHLPVIVIVGIYLFLIIWRNLDRLGKWGNVCLCSIGIMFFVFIGTGYLGEKPLVVNFLDVGQGDSALIITPLGRTVLLDGGGSPTRDLDLGRKVIIPALKYYGKEKLDVVIMSHGHEDHSEGLRDILQRIPVGLFVAGYQKDGCEGYWKTINDAKNKGVPIELLQAGDRLFIDSTTHLKVMHPQRGGFIPGDDNESSLVLMLSYGEMDYLFTGDIEMEALNQLLNSPLQEVEVIKVPHHGSNGSLLSEFYQRVNPQVAVISVGTNRYGHPGNEVLHFLKEKNIEYYRTDEGGAVVFRSDGRNLWLNVLK